MSEPDQVRAEHDQLFAEHRELVRQLGEEMNNVASSGIFPMELHKNYMKELDEHLKLVNQVQQRFKPKVENTKIDKK